MTHPLGAQAKAMIRAIRPYIATEYIDRATRTAQSVPPESVNQRLLREAISTVEAWGKTIASNPRKKGMRMSVAIDFLSKAIAEAEKESAPSRTVTNHGTFIQVTDHYPSALRPGPFDAAIGLIELNLAERHHDQEYEHQLESALRVLEAAGKVEVEKWIGVTGFSGPRYKYDESQRNAVENLLRAIYEAKEKK